MLSNIKQIHQFTPTVAYGDSVSNGILYTQKMLRQMGFISEIYICSKHVDIRFQKEVYDIHEYKESSEQLLIYHFSIGHNYHDMIMDFADKKILVYHNITPSHFFKHDAVLRNLCNQGREQLKESAKYFIGSYADSDYNATELKAYNYKNPQVIPILVHLKENLHVNKKDIIKNNADTYNILFVGRIVQNKVQHQLIEVVYLLKQYGIKNIKLFIVGGASQQDYLAYLHKYAKSLDVCKEVAFTGLVTDDELAAYYKNADLYLSLSEHEGFGIPLVEAMQYDVPVLAYNAGGVSSIVSTDGLLDKKSTDYVVEKILNLMNNPTFRVKLIKKQKEFLSSLRYETIYEKFASYLASFGLNSKRLDKTKEENKTNIQVEGPFDSNYSLSIVNKNLAHELDTKYNVKLYSTEGFGDFIPDEKSLDDKSKELYLKEINKIDITIRNLYPPRTNAMAGFHKVIGPYGWEESSFPKEYIKLFNQRLTHVFCMSRYVKDVLIKNGLKTPSSVTGLGVEQILKETPQELKQSLPNNFKLLHISSCFPRKGVDVLLDVFEDLINEGLDISLIIKTFPNIHNKVEEQIKSLSIKAQKSILLINEDIPQSQINYLYKHSNALVVPSRGEGFGLPMAEAMLFDLPVITTAYSGQVDFCNKETSWLVDFTYEKADTHMNLFNSYWANPIKQSLKEKILEVYNTDETNIKRKTDKAKDNILQNYQWKNVVEKINHSLTSFTCKEKSKQKIAWISTYNTKCGIAAYSDFILKNLNNKDYEFKIFANFTDEIIDTVQEQKVIRGSWKDRFDTSITTLIQDIKEYDSDIVVINFNFAFFSMENLKQLLESIDDKKVIIIFHSVKDVKIKGLESSLSWIKETLQKVDLLLVHSIDDLNFLKNLGCENIDFFPHGVKDRKPLSQKKQDKTFTISSYGFLLPHKGIVELIEAFYLLQNEKPNTKLLLVTALYPAAISHEYYAQCCEKIKELNLSSKVEFITDFLTDEESLSYLDKSDLLVMAYRKTNESSSAATRYAISTRKPVLCTKQDIFSDVKEIVHFTEDFSIESIFTSLKNLFENKELYASKISLQNRWIDEHSWENVAQRLESYINYLMSK